MKALYHISFVICIAGYLGYANMLGVPGSYSSIQSAILAAQHGDTVLVEPGTYKVFDAAGRDVETLLQRRAEPGDYQARFLANAIASGPYFYRLMFATDEGSRTTTKKMILAR